MKKLILNTVSDLVLNFTYYNRKEDEDLPCEAIENAIKNGDITIEEIVAKFETELRKNL